MKRIIAPSLLSADFLNLGKDIDMINNSKAEWIHCDIMDGHFVPNLSFGFSILRQIRSKTRKIMDVHLMITNAEHYINEYLQAGADILTVHFEAVNHLNRVVETIKTRGKMAGISLNPHTPVSLLEEIIPHTDMILLMSVNPGFGGQSFISGTIDKIRKLREFIQKLNPDCLIQVDGGVNTGNARMLFDAGANVLVAGNAVFHAQHPEKEIEQMLLA
jgi:ribulose-phosphate 3-epimerase